MEMPLGIDWLVSAVDASTGSASTGSASTGSASSGRALNLYLQQGVLLVIHMDDLLIAHNGAEGWGHQIKQLLQKKYKMCDLGAAKRFLGIEIEENERQRIQYLSTRLHQHNHTTIRIDGCKTG